jgi:hypothetical protein
MQPQDDLSRVFDVSQTKHRTFTILNTGLPIRLID